MRARALPALLLLLALAGCGGGGGSETTPTTTAPPRQAEAVQEGLGQSPEQGQAGSAKPLRQTPPEPNPPIAQERTPGSKAVAPGVPTTEGGDNSIQAFGTEGEEDQAAQATKTLEAYLNARAAGDWTAACEAASAQYRSQLARMVAPTPDNKEPKGCSETLALLFGEAPPSTLREAARIEEVLSFRIRDDGYAYLIYESEGKVKFIAMANDGGTWKVNTVEPSAFEGPQGEAR